MSKRSYTIRLSDKELARVLDALEYLRSCHRRGMFEAAKENREASAIHYEREMNADQEVWDAIVKRFCDEAAKGTD